MISLGVGLSITNPLGLLNWNPGNLLPNALWRATVGTSVHAANTGDVDASIGGAIGEIEDQTANSRHLVQASASLQPRFGRRPVSGIRNLTLVSEPAVTDLPTRSNISAGATFGAFTSSVRFAGGALGFGYYSLTLPLGVAGQLSVYVKMADGLAPVFGSATTSSALNTFALVFMGGAATPTTYAVEDVGGGIYRVSTPITGLSSGTNTGVVQFGSNQARQFDVTGFQLEVGNLSPYQRTASGGRDVTEAGVPSVTYAAFDLVDDALATGAISGGLTGQAFVAGDGGCYVTDLAIADGAPYSLGGTSHNWTGAPPGILRAVTGNTGRVLDALIRAGSFTADEIDRLEQFYRAHGGKGLLVLGSEISSGALNGALSSASGNPVLSQSNAVTANFYYRIAFTVSGWVSGSVSFRVYGSGGDDVVVTASGNGNFEAVFRARSDATGLVGFSAASATLTISNASLKRLINREDL